MLKFTAIDIVGDELELLQLAGTLLQSRLFTEKEQKKFMLQVQVTGQPARMPIARDQMVGKSGLSYKPPSEFSVMISLAYGLADALDGLAHEMIHMSQLRSGRLKVHVKTKKIDGVKQPLYFAKWGKQKPVMIDSLAYAERGWEQEAYQWQTQLRTDALALMLGAPHQLHLQSDKGELALFEAVGPMASSQSAAPVNASAQPLMPQMPQVPQMGGPQFPAQAPSIQAPQASMATMMPPVSAPPISAPPISAPVSAPPALPPTASPQPVYSTPPSVPHPQAEQVPHQMMEMSPSHQMTAQPAEMAPSAGQGMPQSSPMAQSPQPQVVSDIKPVMARAVTRPAVPAAGAELPAMPSVPMPVEPTSFKQSETQSEPAPNMTPAPEVSQNGLETGIDSDALSIETEVEITPPTFEAELENATPATLHASVSGEIDASPDVVSEKIAEDVIDTEQGFAVMEDAGTEQNAASFDEEETEAVAPPTSLPEAALDDDVLAALMADDAAEPQTDVGLDVGQDSGSADTNAHAEIVPNSDTSGVEASEVEISSLDASGEDKSAADEFEKREIIADQGLDDDIALSLGADAEAREDVASSVNNETALHVDTSEELAVEPAILRDDKASKPVPTMTPEPTVPPQAPLYDSFGSAPDLTALNSAATDTDAAFNPPRFVDVEGVGEARQLNEGAVDSKLKDLQARGLADVDVSRAKQSEELS